MSQTYTQKHFDLLNLIATSPPPIDSSQMVTKLRRPSLEDILSDPTTAAKASNRVSMSGIYVRSRPTSFSELEMAIDPNYDYKNFLACPLSPTAVKDTLTSLGLRLQQGHTLFMQPSRLQGQFQQAESAVSSTAAVVASTAVRPPKPTRPLPNPEGPPPGYMTVMTSGDGYESDGEEIVYMLEEYNLKHQCMVEDAKVQAPDLHLTVTSHSSKSPEEGGFLPEDVQAERVPISTNSVSQCIPEAVITMQMETTEASANNTFRASEDEQKPGYSTTSRASKRMGVIGIQATSNSIQASTEEGSHTQADTTPRSVPRTRTNSRTVTFAQDTVIKRERKVSLSRTRSLKASDEKTTVEATVGQATADGATVCKTTDDQDQILTPAVEVFEVDFAELENANATSIIDGTSGRKAKKKLDFGVYKVIRNVLKRNSGEPKVEKLAAEEPARSKTPTPSIATASGRPNVLRKPDPAAKVNSATASVYSTNVAAETGSQKTKKLVRAWSIRSKKVVADPVHISSKVSTGMGLLAPPATRHDRILRRSASISGFATITTPNWDDPVDMAQLLKDAAEMLQQNPQREWVYRPKVLPILEQGENPIDVGFVLERHVAA